MIHIKAHCMFAFATSRSVNRALRQETNMSSFPAIPALWTETRREEKQAV